MRKDSFSGRPSLQPGQNGPAIPSSRQKPARAPLYEDKFMSKIEKEFGFYPKHLQVNTGSIRISTLPEFEKRIEGVLSSESVYKNWIYPQQGPSSLRVFSLPKTHLFEHTKATGDDHVVFHIWALSFFLGMRLTGTEAGYVDATPVKPGYFVDFSPDLKLEPAIELAERFWMANRGNPRNTQRFAAAVHALFLGQHPKALQYESFIYLYAAIDACYALMKALPFPKKKTTKLVHSKRIKWVCRALRCPKKRTRKLFHSERIEWMCNELGIQTPSWAQKTVGANSTLVSALRNDTLHEALYAEKPLGFEIHDYDNGLNITLEMRNLICRLLVALLGGKDETYLKSQINTRQKDSLSLI